MKIAALVDNLFFTSKIQSTASQTGCDLVFCSTAHEVPHDVGRVIVDLDAVGFDAVEQISELRKARVVPIVTFVRHAHTELWSGAERAGANEVLARSDFVKRLESLLSA